MEITQEHWILLAILSGVLFVIGFSISSNNKTTDEPPNSRPSSIPTTRISRGPYWRPKNAARNIDKVNSASFQKKKLMNQEEYKLFKELEPMFNAHPRKMRLFCQVSLGEILASEDDPGFFAINNTRCDFLVIDSSGWPVVVIEYQGSGHFQGNSAERDEVKRIALKKAGVPTVEVLSNFHWPTIEKEILMYCNSSN